MNLKSILVLIAAGSVYSGVFAADLQAQVQKSSSASSALPQAQTAKYPNIANLIEYNHYVQADNAIKEILGKKPSDADALALRAVSAAKQYKLAPAQTELDRLLKKYPNNANLHYAQGIVHLNRLSSSDMNYVKETKNLIHSAIKEFVKCIELDNKHYQAYNAMGVALLRLDNVNDARGMFNAALKIKPDYATAYDNLGVIELMDNNLAEAEKKFRLSMKYNSANSAAMYHMAQVETRRENYSEALTWLNHSLYLQPQSSPAWNLQGELYLKQGNEAAAINSFKKAVSVKPENSRPYVNLAGVYENRADEEFAIEQLKTAIAVNPNYPEGKLKVADMSLHTKKYEQAVNYYSALLNDKNYGERAAEGLAETYYEMAAGSAGSLASNKDLYLAYDYINRAIEKSPDNLKLYLAKLRLAKLTHQSTPSKESLDYIIQTAGNSLAGSVVKAQAYLAMERESDAVYAFENALNFSGQVDDDLYLADILVQEKQFRIARMALQKALMRDPDNETAKNGIAYINFCEGKANEFLLTAQQQYDIKNYNVAIAYCERAVEFYHNSPAIAKLKARAYEKNKDYRGALASYTQYLAMNPNASDRDEVIRKIDKYSKK